MTPKITQHKTSFRGACIDNSRSSPGGGYALQDHRPRPPSFNSYQHNGWTRRATNTRVMLDTKKCSGLKLRVSVVQFHPWPHFQAIRSVRATWRRDGPSRFSLGRGGVTIASIERFV